MAFGGPPFLLGSAFLFEIGPVCGQRGTEARAHPTQACIWRTTRVVPARLKRLGAGSTIAFRHLDGMCGKGLELGGVPGFATGERQSSTCTPATGTQALHHVGTCNAYGGLPS